MAPGEIAKSEGKPKGLVGAYKDREKPAQIRSSNITAAKGMFHFVITQSYTVLSLAICNFSCCECCSNKFGPQRNG